MGLSTEENNLIRDKDFYNNSRKDNNGEFDSLHLNDNHMGSSKERLNNAKHNNYEDDPLKVLQIKERN